MIGPLAVKYESGGRLMSHLAFPLLLGFTLPLSLPGCGSVANCSAMAFDSLEITVKDGKTGASICDATVTARDGSFAEVLTCDTGPACVCHGVTERPAMYEVTADKPGYTSVSISAWAGTNDCGVEPAHAPVVLTPK